MFDDHPFRATAHARAVMEQWRSHLMMGDYAGYKALLADGEVELAR
ncbi:MAG TPA: hypothetical protein VGD52_19105 [Pseudoduganella sp.]